MHDLDWPHCLQVVLLERDPRLHQREHCFELAADDFDVVRQAVAA